MKNKKYIILMIVLVTIGSAYTVDSEDSGIDFCVWGFSCAEDNSSLDTIVINYFGDYNFTKEGTVNRYSDSGFFKSVEKVINVSRRDYQEVIEIASMGGSFNEIYHLNLKIFKENYTLLIDHSSPTGEYVQNIGEIVSNDYQGDCDDYAMMLYLIAKEKGLDVRYVTGTNLYSGHAWIQIKVDEKWKEYDSTSDIICDDCISGLFIFVDYFEEGNLKEDEEW